LLQQEKRTRPTQTGCAPVSSLAATRRSSIVFELEEKRWASIVLQKTIASMLFCVAVTCSINLVSLKCPNAIAETTTRFHYERNKSSANYNKLNLFQIFSKMKV
jgi:hypothetical protein